jgi:DAHP synthetase I family/DAHP synthase ferredoxin-like domain
MLIVMQAHATEEQVRAVCEKIEAAGYRAHPIPGAERTAVGITGNRGEVELGLEEMPGVAEVIRVTKPYKLVSRDVKQENTVVHFPGSAASVGGAELAVIAGPCAVESREQVFAVAERVHRAGAQFFRGGAYKPRTSPYSFQGLGLTGLKILSMVRKQFGFGIVTEAIDNESLDLVEEYADVIQIGARNMQNFSLLKRAGRAKLPVLLKRGMSATLSSLWPPNTSSRRETTTSCCASAVCVRSQTFPATRLILRLSPRSKSAAIFRFLSIPATAPANVTKFCLFPAPRLPLERMVFSWKSITSPKKHCPTASSPSFPRNSHLSSPKCARFQPYCTAR